MLTSVSGIHLWGKHHNKKAKIKLEALKNSSSHIQKLCFEGGGRGGGGISDDRRNGCGGSVFFFSNKNFLYLILVSFVGLRGFVWGFGDGRGGLFGGEVGGVACRTHPFWGWIAWSVLGANAFGSILSFPGLLSGHSAVFATWTLNQPRRSWRGTWSKSNKICNAF